MKRSPTSHRSRLYNSVPVILVDYRSSDRNISQDFQADDLGKRRTAYFPALQNQ
jgi:hypothetical protein